MKYRILTKSTSRWGEGWQFGDLVDIDDEAARVPLMNGEIELAEEIKLPEPEPEIEDEEEFEIIDLDLKCDKCGKLCKSKIGLQSHLRSHK